MADFIVTRVYQPSVTLGTLTTENNDFACKTLELPWVENLSDVSCIPEGSYGYDSYFSPHLKTQVLLLKDVPGRGDVELHYGNTVLDIKGCCLVGRDFATFTIDGKPYDGVNLSKLTLNQLLKIAGDSGTITFQSTQTGVTT